MFHDAKNCYVRLRQGVLDALDIANLVQQLQEERAAVALNNFLLDVDDADKQTNLDTIKEITGTFTYNKVTTITYKTPAATTAYIAV